jgi:hypothetical protein
MNDVAFHSLASIGAIRPVFQIVVGVFMLVVAWRLAKHSAVWTARLMIGGALMLALGYVVLLPMYEAGLIEAYSPKRLVYTGSVADAMACHVVKVVLMNLGWLAFGVGLAMHAGVLRFSVKRSDFPLEVPQTQKTYESIA